MSGSGFGFILHQRNKQMKNDNDVKPKNSTTMSHDIEAMKTCHSDDTKISPDQMEL